MPTNIQFTSLTKGANISFKTFTDVIPIVGTVVAVGCDYTTAKYVTDVDVQHIRMRSEQPTLDKDPRQDTFIIIEVADSDNTRKAFASTWISGPISVIGTIGSVDIRLIGVTPEDVKAVLEALASGVLHDKHISAKVILE